MANYQLTDMERNLSLALYDELVDKEKLEDVFMQIFRLYYPHGDKNLSQESRDLWAQAANLAYQIAAHRIWRAETIEQMNRDLEKN